MESNPCPGPQGPAGLTWALSSCRLLSCHSHLLSLFCRQTTHLSEPSISRFIPTSEPLWVWSPCSGNLFPRNPAKSLGLHGPMLPPQSSSCWLTVERCLPFPHPLTLYPINLFLIFLTQSITVRSYLFASTRCKLLRAGACLSFSAINHTHSCLDKWEIIIHIFL